MKSLPQFITVQIDDVDGNDVYYTANVTDKETPFPPSSNHPTAIYELKSNIL